MERLLPHAKIQPYSAGASVATADEFSEWNFFVLSGICELRQTQSGTESERLHSFQPGQWVFDAGERRDESAKSLVAVEDSVVLRIRQSDLDSVRGGSDATDGHTTGSTRIEIASAERRGRVTALAFVSRGLPNELMDCGIARKLRLESHGSVLLVRFATDASTAARGRGQFHVILNGKAQPHWIPSVLENEVNLLRVGVPSQSPGGGCLAEFVQSLRRQFDYVLLSTETEGTPDYCLYESVCSSDVAYLFGTPNSSEINWLSVLMRELRVQLNSHLVVRLNPMLCLTEKERAIGYDMEAAKAGVSFHGYVRNCPRPERESGTSHSGQSGDLFQSDLRRIAREICDRLLGLALSSGAEKGFAHVGVLQVLEQNGIEVDIIAGSSMGAYIGAVWACGFDSTVLEKLAREMESPWAIWRLVDPVFPPRQGFLRGYAVRQRLMRSIGNSHFADLLRPIRVVATNLNTLERAVFSSGEVAAAVHASISVPGIFVPVTLGTETYVDGGIAEPLPVDVLREMGISRILAVNTISTPQQIRSCREHALHRMAQQAEQPTRKSKRKVTPLDRHLNYFAPGNILEILMHSFHGAQIRVAEAAGRRASLVLRPQVWDDRWLDFRHPGKYINAGREVALRHLDEIKALANGNGVTHEHETIANALAAAA